MFRNAGEFGAQCLLNFSKARAPPRPGIGDRSFFDHPPLLSFATGRGRCVWNADLILNNADLILNKVSGAHNVIVMAGVPSIMQAMLDEVAIKLKIGVSRRPCARMRASGNIGMQLGEIVP